MTTQLQLALQRRLLKKIAWLLLASCPLYFSSTEAAFNINSCSISLTAINFGAFDPLSDDLATGTVSMTCTVGGSGNALVQPVSLSAGSGTFATRTLKSGTNTLEYNIYTNSARTTVWGDGSGSTSTGSISFSTTGTNQTSSATLYGKIPSKPKVVPGSYSDSITATVTY